MGNTSEMISEEYIKKSCSLSFEELSGGYFHVDKSSDGVVFIVFKKVWNEAEWFSGDGAFGETKIDEKMFPSMRSIGNEDVAIVNKGFLERFQLAAEEASFKEEVEAAVNDNKLIIFTGHSSGGAIAMLAIIWFLERHSKTGKTKCVTFGAPLIGNFIVSHALKREKWSQYFTHFVMRYDIVPRIMLAPRSSIQQELEHVLQFLSPNRVDYARDSVDQKFYTSVMRNASALASHDACKLMGNTNMLLETLKNFIKLSPYRPFGSYIFFTGKGELIQLDNPEAVLQLLFYSSQLDHENAIETTSKLCVDAHLVYKYELSKINFNENLKPVKGLEQLPLASDGTALDNLGLSTRARLCLRAAGEVEKQKQKNQDQIKTKVKDIKDVMAKLSEYKAFNAEKAGYYNAFKKQDQKRDFDANVMRLVLAGIWDEIIEMLKRYDLPDEFEGDRDWINLGTEFRCLVEPLDIANYYRHAKNEDTGAYMVKGRPRRYRYPQRWLEKKDGLEAGKHGESCFWADVEDLLKDANNGKLEKGDAKDVQKRVADAKDVQERVAEWFHKGKLDKDVFLQDSTLHQLWEKLCPLNLQQECLKEFMPVAVVSN